MGAGGGEGLNKHAPQKWQVAGVVSWDEDLNETVEYVRVVESDKGRPGKLICICLNSPFPKEQREAHARLMAAAPRVTDALSEMLVFFADRATTQLEIDAVNEARGALVQAREE